MGAGGKKKEEGTKGAFFKVLKLTCSETTKSQTKPNLAALANQNGSS